MINVSYWHTHGDDPKQTIVSTPLTPNNSYITQTYGNEKKWINPYLKSGQYFAEINLTELNKTENKCDLVKHFGWIEAKNKCGNINKKFDLTEFKVN